MLNYCVLWKSRWWHLQGQHSQISSEAADLWLKAAFTPGVNVMESWNWLFTRCEVKLKLDANNAENNAADVCCLACCQLPCRGGRSESTCQRYVVGRVDDVSGRYLFDFVLTSCEDTMVQWRADYKQQHAPAAV